MCSVVEVSAGVGLNGTAAGGEPLPAGHINAPEHYILGPVQYRYIAAEIEPVRAETIAVSHTDISAEYPVELFYELLVLNR